METKLEKYKSEFFSFIIDTDHPCLMAQSVIKNNQLNFKTYDRLGDESHISDLLRDLYEYLHSYDFLSNDLYTFVAAFPQSTDLNEEQFEAGLWQELQLLHNADTAEWDTSVSKDPESDNFSFSLGAKAFYIVGMHPESSRMARRSPFPVLVFNLHHQFEMLREMNAYGKTKKAIRARDRALQGSVNPMLADFGKGSEARQYSGKASGKDWKCPFSSKSKE